VLFASFLLYERRASQPMLPLELFSRRNFSVGNLETFAMYGGLGASFFFLAIFLQQVAGYDAVQAGLATLPATLMMFLLSKRAGRLADRHGPRLFMGLGPIVSALGLAGMTRLDASFDYWTELFPPLVLFSAGLVATVAPLTATVLADADESNAGIASGVNNAIARIAGLLAVAAVGAVVAAQFSASLDKPLARVALPPAGRAAVDDARREILARVDPGRTGAEVAAAVEDASVHAFHVGMGIAAGLVALGGVLGLAAIRNPRREVRCEDCAGGQFAGQPADAARERLPVVVLPRGHPARAS